MTSSSEKTFNYRFFVLTVLVASIVLLPILWLMDSGFRIYFYVLSIMLAVALCFVLVSSNTKTFRLNFNTNWILNIVNIVCFLLTLFSLLHLLNFIYIDTILRVAIAVLTSTFLPGWVILRLSGIFKKSGPLEFIVMSIICGFFLTGVLVLIFNVLLAVEAWAVIVLILYLALSVVNIVKSFRYQGSQSQPILISSFNIRNILVLVLIGAIFALALAIVLPEYAMVPFTDVASHYKYSLTLMRMQSDLYPFGGEILWHTFLAFYYQIADAPYLIATVALSYLSFLVVPAFYVMARKFLGNINSRLPIISTVLFALMSGFAWIYVSGQKLVGISNTDILLQIANNATYWGTSRAHSYGFFITGLTPVMLSVTTFLMFLYLMKREEAKTPLYFLFFSFLFLANFLLHVHEAIFFLLLLAAIGLWNSSWISNFRKVTLSVILGLTLVLITYYFLSWRVDFLLTYTNVMTVLLPISLLIISFAFASKYRVSSLFSRVKPARIALPVALVLTVLCVLSLLTWCRVAPSFRMSNVEEVGLVPWFFYAEELGIKGVLAILGVYVSLSAIDRFHNIKLIALVVIVAIVGGRVISCINSNFFFTGWWEYRFLYFIGIGTALLGSVGLVSLLDFVVKKMSSRTVKRTLVTAFVISIFLFAGISTTLLSVEHRYAFAQNYSISSLEEEAQSFLKEYLDRNPRSLILTPTLDSWYSLRYSGAPTSSLSSLILFNTKNPDQALTMLHNPNYDRVLLYFHQRDLKSIQSSETCITTYIYQHLQLLFENNEVQIYELPKLVAPSEHSDTTLIIPPTSLDSLVSFTPDLSAWSEIGIQWNLTEQGSVIGGWQESYGEAFLQVKNITLSDAIMSVDVKIYNSDQQEGLVFRGVDQDTFYEIIFEDNQDKLSFCKKVNGTYYAINSALFKPELNKWYKLKVVAEGSSFEFYVDGKLIFTASDVEFSSGDFNGLFLGRVNPLVEFKNFMIVDSSMANDIRAVTNTAYTILSLGGFNFTAVPWLDSKLCENSRVIVFPMDPSTSFMQTLNFTRYLEAVKNGGVTLIVLNTNGYGILSNDFLGEISDKSLTASKLVNDHSELTIPELGVNIVEKVPEGSIATSYYQGEDGQVPFSVYSNVGKGQVIYVNLFPLVASLQKEEYTYMLPQLLGNVLTVAEVEIPVYQPMNEVDIRDQFIFKELMVDGSIAISTNAILLPNPFSGSIKIENNGQIINITENAWIEIFTEGQLELVTSNVKPSGSLGAYSAITLTLPIQISVREKTEVLVTTAEGISSYFSLEDGATLELYSEDALELYALRPHFEINGTTTFKEAYSGDQTVLRTSGENLIVNGTVSFDISSSDVYSVVDNLQLLGEAANYSPKAI